MNISIYSRFLEFGIDVSHRTEISMPSWSVGIYGAYVCENTVWFKIRYRHKWVILIMNYVEIFQLIHTYMYKYIYLELFAIIIFATIVTAACTALNAQGFAYAL